MMRIWYALPDGQVIELSNGWTHNVNWLYSMMKGQDDVIFFYTVDSTDIWLGE